MDGCKHCRRAKEVSRRDFVRLTLGTAAGLGIASKFGLGWAQDQVNPARAKAKAVILLWMQGGPSQLETFDPKPGTETGGPTKAIDTAIKGVQICEHLPQVAKIMDKISLIRTLNSNDPNHETAIYYLHTGYRKEPLVDRPSLGCVVSKEIGDDKFDLPASVVFGNTLVGPGVLGPRYSPFHIGKVDTPLENVVLPTGVTMKRMKDREALLRSQQDEFRKNRDARELDDHAMAYEQALKIVHSTRLDAFDISKEPDKVRKAYGDTSFGKACLMGRRLVEAGVKFVEISLGDWDTHDNNFQRTKDLCGQLDPAMAALIRDLSDRKLLDETLVIWMGEFGRTPVINQANGRDHFTKAWSVALAGAGIKGGRVVGRTNDTGTDVAERPVKVADLFATIYDRLGIDTNQKMITPEGRPFKYLDHGDILKELV